MAEGNHAKKERKGFSFASSGIVMAKVPDSEDVKHVHAGEYVKCNLCGRNDTKAMFTCRNYGVEFTVVRCRNCNLAYINPRMPAHVIESMYSGIETIHLGFAVSACGILAKNRRWHDARFEKMMLHHSRENPDVPKSRKIRYLDMGCGTGQTLEFAAKRGWEAHGIDISKYIVEQGRAQGRDILLTNLEDAPFEDGYFDIILLCEVIEHMTDPLSELKLARRKMRDGGIIVVDTINIDSFFMKFLGERSSFIEAGHITYFNYRTLGMILEEAGFQVLKGYRGLEIDLGDYIRIYSEIFGIKEFSMELALSALRKIGFGDFCFGGISFYAVKR